MSEPARRRQSTFPVLDIQPWTVPVAALLAVLLMFAVVLLVDVGGAFGGIPALEDIGFAPPAAWFQFFQDRGLAEFLQWALLGWFVILAATLRGSYAGRDGDLASFWGLLAVFGFLMMAEDAGGVRDTLRHWGEALLGSPFGDVASATWFAAIAGVFAYAIVRHGREVVRDSGVRRYGIAGTILMIAASAGQIVEHAVGWMGPFGAWLTYDVLAAPQLAELPGFETGYLNYLFTDFVFEEPLELLGLALLVAAVLVHIRSQRAHEAAPA